MLQIESVWTSIPELAINKGENRPVRRRALDIVGQLHSLRHSTTVGGMNYSRRLVAQSLPLTSAHVLAYVSDRMDREKRDLAAYMDGGKRLYELIDVSGVEDAYNEELRRELLGLSDQIAGTVLTKLLSEVISDLTFN